MLFDIWIFVSLSILYLSGLYILLSLIVNFLFVATLYFNLRLFFAGESKPIYLSTYALNTVNTSKQRFD